MKQCGTVPSTAGCFLRGIVAVVVQMLLAESQELLGHCSARLDADETHELIGSGMDYVESQQYEAAALKFRQAQCGAPESVRLVAMEAQALEFSGRTGLALDAYRRARSLQPENLEATR